MKSISQEIPNSDNLDKDLIITKETNKIDLEIIIIGNKEVYIIGRVKISIDLDMEDITIKHQAESWMINQQQKGQSRMANQNQPIQGWLKKQDNFVSPINPLIKTQHIIRLKKELVNKQRKISHIQYAFKKQEGKSQLTHQRTPLYIKKEEDLHENFSSYYQVVYSGEYKNGQRLGQWNKTNLNSNMTEKYKEYDN